MISHDDHVFGKTAPDSLATPQNLATPIPQVIPPDPPGDTEHSQCGVFCNKRTHQPQNDDKTNTQLHSGGSY